MVHGCNGAAFQWYFSRDRTFNGIFLKFGSFNGIELIFPNKKAVSEDKFTGNRHGGF
jgi:hypothetical protein